MKKFRIPFVGFAFYLVSFVVLLVGYILSISSFVTFSISVDRFVIILPIFAMIIIVLQLIMSLVDANKPAWFNLLNLAFVILIVFTFAKVIIPFLTPIGIYFSGVNMGDVATYQKVVPMSIASCIILVVSALIFIVGSFFPTVLIIRKEEKAK